MDKTAKKKRVKSATALFLAAFACACFIPSAVLAESAASTTRVGVTVRDAVSVNFGKDALSNQSRTPGAQITTQLITRTAPPTSGSDQLPGHESTGGGEAGLPAGQAIAAAGGAVRDAGPAPVQSEVVITVTML